MTTVLEYRLVKMMGATAHNGVVRWPIRTVGRASHSSDPAQGRSAISAMAKVILHLERGYIAGLTAAHPLTGQAQCSINLIQGGRLINIIPDSCEIRLDRRLVPGEDGADTLVAVEAALAELRLAEPDLTVVQDPPLLVDPALDDQVNAAFAPRVAAVLASQGLSPAAVGMKFGTHASTFGAAGWPAVVLGPGSIEQAHTADEWIDLDQLRRGADLYLALMKGM